MTLVHRLYKALAASGSAICIIPIRDKLLTKSTLVRKLHHFHLQKRCVFVDTTVKGVRCMRLGSCTRPLFRTSREGVVVGWKWLDEVLPTPHTCKTERACEH